MKVTIDKKNSKLVIEMDLISPPRPSGSGKTLLIASTGGNKESDAVVNNQNVYVGVNAYIYAVPKANAATTE